MFVEILRDRNDFVKDYFQYLIITHVLVRQRDFNAWSIDLMLKSMWTFYNSAKISSLIANSLIFPPTARILASLSTHQRAPPQDENDLSII